jgi:hypothetical protein
MALTGRNASAQVFDPARAAPGPREALARLSGIYREQARDLSLGLLLSRSPTACVALMLTGTAALLLTGASLKSGFGWAVLMLIGIVAMVRNFIRGAARSLRRVPLEEAAGDLRLLLLYSGGAWAGGAWLLMPGLPSPALAFSYAAVPALALALILKDEKATLAFTAPVALGVAGAAILGAWPLALWVAIAILAAAFGIILLPALQHADKSPPPGLTLR